MNMSFPFNFFNTAANHSSLASTKHSSPSRHHRAEGFPTWTQDIASSSRDPPWENVQGDAPPSFLAPDNLKKRSTAAKKRPKQENPPLALGQGAPLGLNDVSLSAGPGLSRNSLQPPSAIFRPMAPDPDPPPQNVDKPFKCTFCQNCFRRKDHLKIHERIHTGERPYKCDYCPSAFPKKDRLERHVRSHTGEKPYKCRFCPSAFATKDRLTRHERTHTGEKPYKCRYCPQAFARKEYLAKHERTHTRTREINNTPATFTDLGAPSGPKLQSSQDATGRHRV